MLIQSIFRDLKKIHESTIRPFERLYKYRDITTRLISDAEIFAKPMIMFLGAKSSGKTSLANYLLGLQSTPWQLKTGYSTSPHFTALTYGDNYSKLSPTELSADHAFSNLQQFGQHFLEHHMYSYRMPLSILQKLTIVDSPGLVDGTFVKSPEPGKGVDSEVYQWFIDRSDVIYIVIDVSQVHVSQSLQSLLEQLKGREIRFLINKADIVPSSTMIMLMGQLLWMLSPIMPSDQPPQVYAITSATTDSYDAFLDSQEQLWLQDLADQISGLQRVESRVAAVRRHAVRVRNHAKLIDCYLGAYYRNAGFFSFGTDKKLATDITENPHQYRIFSGAVAGQSHNISRYDLPDPAVYREFFRVNNLVDFKPLSSTCSLFGGCPIDKLDSAIAYTLPELIGKYKKLTKTGRK
jgi:GTPase SAR1 family protein